MTTEVEAASLFEVVLPRRGLDNWSENGATMPRSGPTRVLVVAPTDADSTVRQVLEEAELESDVCADPAAVADELERAGAGAVLLPADVLDHPGTAELAAWLEGQPTWSDLSVVLLADPDQTELRTRAADELIPNLTILERSVRPATLVSALRSAIRGRRRQYELRTRLGELERAKDQVKALNASLRRELARMTTLHDLSARLVTTRELEPLLEHVLEAAIEITGADKGNVQVVEDGALRIVVQRGFDRGFLEYFDSVHSGSAACGTALELGRRIVVEDVASSDLFADAETAAVLEEASVRALQATPLTDRSGEIVGMISTHHAAPREQDPSDLRMLDLLARQAADAIERVQAEQALHDADERKDLFLATLSHELRNPLAPMRAALRLLDLSPETPGPGRARAVLDRQLSHLVRLIDDLMDMSRISRGDLELRRQPLAMDQLLRGALETAAPRIDEHGHLVCVSMPAEPVYVNADPVRMNQAVSNLLNNACKYMDAGGRIWFGAAADGDELTITVRDAGSGIARADLDSLFEPFIRGRDSLVRMRPGLGVGLPLVKHLIELHGGTITAQSEGAGHGACFTICLPVCEKPVATPAAGTPRRSWETVRRRVLVADDNADMVESMSELLAALGHEVATAADGREALAEAESFRPDIALLDVGMPELDGYTVARKIREQDWGKDMMLVAVTGWGQDEDRERALAAGFDRHFTKPLDLPDLRLIVGGPAA